ncbi:unnamed protein product [Phytophthora lilii]|uniref:Unnamed protein product n=1 Tax=Phytophthora lilii TaxID=2077276 RepID=A0A9W6WYK9_9STRA|nr:unnamed protein product [Phytophthora lilii]
MHGRGVDLHSHESASITAGAASRRLRDDDGGMGWPVNSASAVGVTVFGVATISHTPLVSVKVGTEMLWRGLDKYSTATVKSRPYATDPDVPDAHKAKSKSLNEVWKSVPSGHSTGSPPTVAVGITLALLSAGKIDSNGRINGRQRTVCVTAGVTALVELSVM